MTKHQRLIAVGLLFILMLVGSAATAYKKLDYLYKSSDSGWRAWNKTSVTRVWPQSPAASVLRVGDEVVTLNGRRVETLSPGALDFYGFEPGTTYTISVRRHGQLREYTLRTRPFPLLFWLAWIQALVVLPAVFLFTGLAIFLLKPYDKQALLLALLLFSGPKENLPEYAIASLPWWLGGLVEVNHSIWPPLFISALLHFFLVFPERSPLVRRFPRIEYYLYLPALVVAGAGAFRARWPPLVEVSEIVRLFMPLYVAGALVSLILNYRRATPMARRKLRVVLAGSVAGFLPVLALMVVAVSFDISWDNPLFIQFLAVTLFTITLVPLSFAYAIVRHQVIPVSLIIRRGIRYFLVSRGFIITEAIVILVLLSYLLTGSRIAAIGRVGTRAYIVTVMAVTAGAVLLLRLMHHRVMPVIDRHFFREAYDAQQLLTELGQAVRTVTNIMQLLELVATQIQAALHAGNVTIFLRDEATGDYVAAISYAHARGGGQRHASTDTPPLSLAMPHDSSKVRILCETAQPLTIDVHDPRPSASSPEHDSRRREDETLRRTECALLLPMTTTDRMHGIISLSPRLGDVPYSSEDKRMLMTVAWQTALAIENAQLIERKAEEERMRRELEMAAAVQRRLFPERPPEVAGLELAGVCHPARGVGGDYYDFIPLGSGRVGIAVADVAGKGMSAALLMSTVQAALRSQARSAKGRLTEMVSAINELLYSSTGPHSYATFFYAEYDENTRLMTYVNAGHNPPILVRNAQGAVRAGEQRPQRIALTPADAAMMVEAKSLSANNFLLTVGGPVIGVFVLCTYDQETIQTEEGDVLIAYTDGVTEALSPEGEEFGEARLHSLVAATPHLSAEGLSERILGTVREWCRGAPQHDDLTLVVAKVTRI